MKFNKFIATALSAMVALTMTACEEGDSSMDDGGDDDSITLDLSTQRITLDGQDTSDSETLRVETNGDWEITLTDDTCDWLTLSSTEGSGDAELTLGSAEVNPYITARSTQILVSAGDNNEIVYVEQSAGLPRLEIVNNEDLDLVFTNAGCTQVVQLDCNTNWNAVDAYSGEASGWLTLSMSASAGTLSVKADENTEAIVKSATITITATDVEEPIIINVTLDIDDSSAFLNVDPTSLTFPAAGDTKTFEIDSNAQWTIDEISAEDAEWLTISDMSGTGDKTITVTTPNFKGAERSVTLSIGYSSSKDPVSFVITQEAYVAAISVEESAKTQEILAVGGTKTIAVTSNTTWTAVSSETWLEVTEGAEGENDGSFTIKAGEYDSTAADRTAKITLTGADVAGNPIEINVTQKKVTLDASLDLSLTSHNFTTAGGEKDVTITSANTTWSWEKTAESPADWLTVSGADASGNTASGTLKLEAGTNYTTTAKTATITITYDSDQTKTFTVTQDKIDAESITVAASYVDGKTIDLVLSSAHTFDSSYSYSSSNFVISYKNDYNDAEEVSGTVTLDSTAVSTDGLTLTITLDESTPIYNTDEITISTSGVLMSALSDSKNMLISNLSVTMPAVGVVYSEDFETSGAYDRGWRVTATLTGNGNYPTVATELDNINFYHSNDYTANSYSWGVYNTANGNAQNTTGSVLYVPKASIAGTSTFLIFSPAIEVSAGEYFYKYLTFCDYATNSTTQLVTAIITRLPYDTLVYNNDDNLWVEKNYISNSNYLKGQFWKYFAPYVTPMANPYTTTTVTATEGGTIRLVVEVQVVGDYAGDFDFIFDEFSLEAVADERPRD